MDLWTVSINADPRYSIYGDHGGGQGKFVRTVAEEMPSNGWNVTTITSSSGAGKCIPHHNDIANLVDLEHPTTSHISSRIAEYPGCLIPKVDELIETRPPPLAILCCHALSWPLARHIHERTSAPIISSLCSSGQEKEEGLGEIDISRRYLEKELIHKSTMLLASSISEHSILIDRYNTAPEKIVIIPRPVDTNTFCPGPEPIQFKILFAGRPTRQKGIDIFLKAISLLDEQHIPITIVGCTREDIVDVLVSSRLKRKINIENITLLSTVGHVNMPNVIREHSVVVVPSRYETYGNIAVEAMACGVPVVATNVGALREHINNSSAGYLVDPESPDNLANAIIRLIKKPNKRKKMGSLGRAYAMKANKNTTINRLSGAIITKLGLAR